MAFLEVADRVWVARYPWLDVNVCAVAGTESLLVLDTQASAELASTAIADLRSASHLPVRWAINSHHHFDHTFGNATFAALGAELICHENAAAELPEHAESAIVDHPELAGTAIQVPERTFSSALTLDLGDRLVELIHPGRGHTSGDLVVRVPDADVVLAGDLVEQGVPGFGDDCFPMEWPLTLDIVLGISTGDSVVVPGHGAPVDRDFVEEQRNLIGVVAETIRDLAGRGIPVDQAVREAEWPFPAEQLAGAVRRGYLHLPRSQKRLPLV